MEKEPQVLAEKAREILRDIGYPEPPADRVFRYTGNRAYFQYVQKNNQSPTRFDKLPALGVLFWYRQSPERLAHSVTSDDFTPTEPPLINNGEAVVCHCDGKMMRPNQRLMQVESKGPPRRAALFLNCSEPPNQ